MGASSLRFAAPQQPPPQARRPRLGLQPLVPRGQPSRLPRRQRALRVRVPPPGRVALGRDQHVLAQGGQEAVAERAAVGRGLSVLGPADRPPASLLELRHRPKSDLRKRSRAPWGPRATPPSTGASRPCTHSASPHPTALPTPSGAPSRLSPVKLMK